MPFFFCHFSWGSILKRWLHVPKPNALLGSVSRARQSSSRVRDCLTIEIGGNPFDVSHPCFF